VKVNQYIKDLLFTHDSVIISGLGAFEAKYQPAKINPEDNTMLPPTKEIQYNPSLKLDDGLLSNYIASRESIPIEEAQNRIKEFVAETTDKLAKGEKVEFADLGYLASDSQKNLQFSQQSQDSLLFDSFGMPPVKLSSTGQKKNTIKSEKLMATDEKVVTGTSKKKKIIKYSIIALPIILIIILFVWKFQWIKTQSFALKQKYFDKNAQIADNNAKTNNDSIIKVSTDSVKHTNNLTKQTPNVDSSEILKKQLYEKVKVVKTPTKNISAKAKYYLIAGSFKTRNNAEKLKKTIGGRGFTADIMATDDNLFRVTVGSYNNAKDAIKEYERFHSANKDIYVWLLDNN